MASPTPLKLSAIVSLGSAIRFPSKFGISSLWSKEVGFREVRKSLRKIS